MSVGMPTSRMGQVRRIHFVGVGGAGMGGIAEVLANQGYIISGTDLNENAVTERLRQHGVQIFIGHSAEHIQDIDVVVRSTAVLDHNPEIMAAHAAGIPVIARAQMLGELMRFRYGIAVAGTHGKTTTTSLVTCILTEAKLDPTFVIGGLLNSSGSHARLGSGEYLVAEADESDASFLYLQPMIAIVTNIDADHMSTYAGDFEKLKQTFVEFLQRLPFYGLAVLCAEDLHVRSILETVSRPILTYGFSEGVGIRASQVTQTGVCSEFVVERVGRANLPIKLNLPGKHNVLNALAAIGIATELGVADDVIQRALTQFSGVGRRFQLSAQIHLYDHRICLIDDYGHHPREILVTLEAIRAAWPKRRLVMAYQPHRYTRTRDLFEFFVDVLSRVDVLLLLEVYSAGETLIPEADSQTLARAIRKRGSVEPIFIKDVSTLFEVLPNVLQTDDVLLLQGAGNIGGVAARLRSMAEAAA